MTNSEAALAQWLESMYTGGRLDPGTLGYGTGRLEVRLSCAVGLSRGHLVQEERRV